VHLLAPQANKPVPGGDDVLGGKNLIKSINAMKSIIDPRIGETTMLYKYFFYSACMLWSSDAIAQLAPPNLPANPPRGANNFSSLTDFFGGRTPYEFWLTIVIIAFGLLIILLLLRYFRTTPGYHPQEMVRSVVVVTVIIGTLILVTAGYSNEQIAPAFGLFGTIVGYILGRIGQNAPTDKSE
jgi:FtsH-binding integral membrane protein